MMKSLFSMRKIVTLMLIVTLLSQALLPLSVHAVFTTVTEIGGNLVTNLVTTGKVTAQTVKEYVLDTLAYSIAGIMLQQVTASVVNWINTGFQGNPSFLTNPEAFFLDVGDQITGNFISETGVLSGLCTPFSIDIRLALALGQNNNMYKRYTCTLNSVIQNVGNSTINGRSINGFMNGDFSQGGWPAFITMTTQPQNNIVGAYLTAQSDLLQKIGVTQNRYSQDLIQGSGFLSWKKCTDISEDDYMAQRDYDEEMMGADYSSLNSSGNRSLNVGTDMYSGGDVSVQKSGSALHPTYKSCETQTPGSVIGGAINKSLGIPQDRLNLAASFNQIVSALFAQLVTQVLSGGLKSASNPGPSGIVSGIAYQLSTQTENDQLADARQRLHGGVTEYYMTTSQYVQLRQQAVDSITSVKNQYLAAKVCFDMKVGSTTPVSGLSMDKISYARSEMASIDTAIATKIVALENIYGPKLTDANNKKTTIQKLLLDIDNATTTGSIQKVSETFSTAVQGGSIDQTTPNAIPAFTSQIDIMNAQNDLQTLQEQLTPLSIEASQFQESCNMFPNYFMP